MATKKQTTRTKKKTVKRRKKKQGNVSFSSILFSFRKILIGAVCVTISFIGLLFFFEYWYSPKAKGESNRVMQSISLPSSTHHFPKELEIPYLKTERKEQVIRHEGYTVSYNSDYRIPNWVAWELNADEAKSNKVPRSDKFYPDPEVKGATALNEDYTGTGFDRGHLAPAADMKWSEKAMRECFYFSNICPQNRKMNGGIWRVIEEKSRKWAIQHDTILIVAGPVITEKMRRLGKNRVAVPNHFYKVICTYSNNKYQGVAFLLENRDYGKTPLWSLAIPIDSVERATGIEFFPTLPTESREEMIRTVDRSCWSF